MDCHEKRSAENSENCIGFKNVWTYNGVIYAETDTGVKKIDVQS